MVYHQIVASAINFCLEQTLGYLFTDRKWPQSKLTQHYTVFMSVKPKTKCGAGKVDSVNKLVAGMVNGCIFTGGERHWGVPDDPREGPTTGRLPTRQNVGQPLQLQ